MILRRFYHDGLAQASYLVGCSATGDALVVDPNRSVRPYVEAAARERLRITHVAETHIHADFVSGTRALAADTGATPCLSAEGGPDWRYAFAEAAGAMLLRDGHEWMVGRIRIRALHTPGHTPEHLSFLLTDTAVSDAPMGVFTGDFVFVSDVGRPDLLERAANVEGAMEIGARTLFDSLQRFRALPDHVQIWPGHGAGSACGKALGAMPQSTVGYERLVNWAFSVSDQNAFLRTVLDGQPDPPKYFATLKRVNRDAPPATGDFARPEPLTADRIPGLLESGAVVVDTRAAADYARRHIPGTLNIPLNRAFCTWAGWLLPYDRDIHVIAQDGALDEVLGGLALVGIERVASAGGDDVVEAWMADRPGGTVRTAAAEAVPGLVESGRGLVLDVRDTGEWAAGHVPGGRNIPLGRLTDRLAELPPDRPIVVHCQGGTRSAIAASLLQARGFPNVIDFRGGFREWEQSKYPVERAERADPGRT